MNFPAILHSVSYSGSWGQVFLPLDGFIDKAAELGFDGVLLAAKRPHLSLLDYGEKERARVRTRLEEKKLGVVVLAGYNNFSADLEHRDIPNFEIQVQYVVELARLARDVGAGMVRIFTAYEHPASSYGAVWDLVVKALKEASRRAADFGVTLGVQNHHDVGVGYESYHELITAVDEPNCRAMFDAWAPALQGADLQAAAARLGSLTVHTTIANYQKQPRYRYEPALVNYVRQPDYVKAVPMEEGFIDYGAFLADLAKAGFRGSVAYEMCSPLRGGGGMENLDCYARGFLGFMKKVRASLG